jgi:serine/threonine protein kinase
LKCLIATVLQTIHLLHSPDSPIRGDSSADTRVYKADFERESKLLWAIDHPNVVTLLGVVRDEDSGDLQGFVLEKASATLENFLAGVDTMSVQLLYAICDGVLSGLACIHSLNPSPIIHRDIKPDNVLVFLDESGQLAAVKLSDVDLAKPLSPDGRVSRGGAPRYHAPELRSGEGSPKMDMYSFGLMMVEAVFTKFGEPRVLDHTVDSLRPFIEPALAKLESYPSLVAVLRGCLENDPGKRLSSQQALTLLRKPCYEWDEKVVRICVPFYRDSRYHFCRFPAITQAESDTVWDRHIALQAEVEELRACWPRTHAPPRQLSSVLFDSVVLAKSTFPQSILFLEALTQEWLPGRAFRLVYRGSRDGMTPAAFHDKCDDVGPTLVLIRGKSSGIPVEGTFGGFAAESWTSPAHPTYHPAPGSFLFTISSAWKADLPPTRFPVVNPSHALFCDRNQGPMFGLTVQVRNNDNPKNNNPHFPFTSHGTVALTGDSAYPDAVGFGNPVFTGASSFRPGEVEVYAVMMFE